jgi:hypothetical protein
MFAKTPGKSTLIFGVDGTVPLFFSRRGGAFVVAGGVDPG